MNIVEKYYWITQHPAYVPFGDDAIIEILPQMVCPETKHIEKLELLNTKLEFWVELSIPFVDEENNQYGHSHDYELDCCGDTWEEAVENLYQLVLKKYGNYTQEDLDNQCKEAIEKHNLSHFINEMMKVDENSEIDNNEVELFEDYEIERMVEELKHLKVLKQVLADKVAKKFSDNSLSMKEYSEFELEMIAVDHDLEITELNIKHGYNVEKYGIHDENSETSVDSIGNTAS